jgi:hypothetical protein
MGIPLVIFSNEREIGFGHLALRPGNYSKIADASYFLKVLFSATHLVHCLQDNLNVRLNCACQTWCYMCQRKIQPFDFASSACNALKNP